MGCNFYLVIKRGTDRRAYRLNLPRNIHIGKRSAAGLYCWDCDISLHHKGNKFVHHSDRPLKDQHLDWHTSCPKCGNAPQRETLEESSSGRELGFNQSKPRAKKGVKTCSSFTWAIDQNSLKNYSADFYVVKSEYGQIFTIQEFLNILCESPIRFFEMVGRNFD